MSDPVPEFPADSEFVSPAEENVRPSRNVMLTISYRGSRYHGWQVQPNGITVQECVETAVLKLTGVATRVLCAGRTDSGVHAVGQVAGFRTESRIPAWQLRRGLQAFLPDDIVITSVRDVHDTFHATFSAVRKRYRYVMHWLPMTPPFLLDQVLALRRRPHVAAMQDACRHLLGTHDFRCFETHFPNKLTSVRTILEARLSLVSHWSPWDVSDLMPMQQLPNDDGMKNTAAQDSELRALDPQPFLVFDVVADGFLYNMVRAIVGTLLEIGTEKHPPEWMADVIAAQDRAAAGMTAPAAGLYLMHVDYPADQLTPAGDARTAKS